MLILILMLCLLMAAPVMAQEEDEANFIELAALMLRDGNLDRAINALDQVDLSAEDTDIPRYYTLRGMTHMRRKENQEARAAFQSAIDNGQTDSVVHVYLAQLAYEAEDYQAALAALDQAGAAVARVPSVYHMRAQANWLLEKHARALAVLDQASELFPAETAFQRRKVFYLIDLGLYQAAADQGRDYLQQIQGAAEDYVAIGNALRQSGQLDEALAFLEAARLKWPADTNVTKALAHTYLDREELNTAADLIYQASLLDPALAGEAVELYRRAGQNYRALTLNGQLNDQATKLKQRLALLLKLKQFDEAAAMHDALVRNNLLGNEDIRYALAYALFKTGEFDRAEQHLSLLTRSDLFRKATELRKAINDCGDQAWQCI